MFYIFVNATLPESTELLCKNRSTIKWTFIQFLYEWHGQLSALRRSHVRFRGDVYVEGRPYFPPLSLFSFSLLFTHKDTDIEKARQIYMQYTYKIRSIAKWKRRREI